MMQLTIILFIAGFLRTLLVIVAIYYIIRFVGKVLVPMFMGSQQQKRNFQKENRRKEGDVTIERNQGKNNRYSKDDGDYVDFEEVE